MLNAHAPAARLASSAGRSPEPPADPHARYPLDPDAIVPRRATADQSPPDAGPLDDHDPLEDSDAPISPIPFPTSPSSNLPSAPLQSADLPAGLDHHQLLTDTVMGDLTSLAIARIHGLSPVQYLAWLDLPETRAALDACAQADARRARFILNSNAAKAAQQLRRLLNDDPELAHLSPTARETLRRTASQIIRHTLPTPTTSTSGRRASDVCAADGAGVARPPTPTPTPTPTPRMSPSPGASADHEQPAAPLPPTPHAPRSTLTPPTPTTPITPTAPTTPATLTPPSPPPPPAGPAGLPSSAPSPTSEGRAGAGPAASPPSTARPPPPP